MAFCPTCGAPVDGRFCAKCGTPAAANTQSAAGSPQPSYSSHHPSVGLTDNVAAALCYALGLITGILFLVLAPYNQNRTIRFHAFQSERLGWPDHPPKDAQSYLESFVKSEEVFWTPSGAGPEQGD